MSNKDVKVVILGGSGHLGKSVFSRFKSMEGVDVRGTYYENRPKTNSDDDFMYFNAGASHLDQDTLDVITSADFVFNFMKPKRADYFDSVLFDTPLKLAELVKEKGGAFISFGGSVNENNADSDISKAIRRLSNVLTERGLGSSIYTSLVLDSKSRLIARIASLSKYKLTPLVGDGGNRITPLHVTDFSMIVARLISKRLSPCEYELFGRETMTFRHLISITCSQKKMYKPIFLNIKKSIFLNNKGFFEGMFDIKLSKYDINELDYKESKGRRDLCKFLRVKPLSFDARVKREGL